MPRTKRDVTSIDPNQVPSLQEQRATGVIRHPEPKQNVLKYDQISLVIHPVTNDKPLQTFKGTWTGDESRVDIIPEKFLNRDQPFVGTCSRPIKDRNMGCFSHNGCPYPDQEDPRGRGPGPFNVIIEKDGQKSSCPCYHAYHGTRNGLPNAQVHYLYSGFRIDTEGTTIPSTKATAKKDEWGNHIYEDVEIAMPVTELGPMYSHHFGKRKQRVKAERAEVQRHGFVDDGEPNTAGAHMVNTAPGNLANAPRPSGTQGAKLGK